jgi:hypothetical protein
MEMEIGDVANLLQTSFVVLEASWPSDQGRRLVLDLAPTHVIIRSGTPQVPLHFLFQTDKFLAGLESGGSEIALALALKDSDAVPLVAATENADRAPPRCIVHEDGIIVGVFDADTSVTEAESADPARRGAAKEEAPANEPAMATRELLTGFPKEVELGVSTSLTVSITAPSTDGRGLSIRRATGNHN